MEEWVESFGELSFEISVLENEEVQDGEAVPRVDEGSLRGSRYVDDTGHSVLAIKVSWSMPKDRRSFMQFTLLVSKICLKPGGMRQVLLNDPASNAGLIDEDLFLANYPHVKIHTADRLSVKRVGNARTVG